MLLWSRFPISVLRGGATDEEITSPRQLLRYRQQRRRKALRRYLKRQMSKQIDIDQTLRALAHDRLRPLWTRHPDIASAVLVVPGGKIRRPVNTRN